MCFGSAPQPPQLVYQGPSEADIAANRAAMDRYSQQLSAQQEAFAKQLQTQIDEANARANEQRASLEAEQKAASAEIAAMQTGTYAATATQSEAPAGAMTTTAAKPKEKSKTSLKIAPGATQSTAGSGINIGV
jgi:hypothetical protein